MKKKRKIVIGILIAVASLIPYRISEDAPIFKKVSALLYSYEEAAEINMQKRIGTETTTLKLLWIPVYTDTDTWPVCDD